MRIAPKGDDLAEVRRWVPSRPHFGMVERYWYSRKNHRNEKADVRAAFTSSGRTHASKVFVRSKTSW